MASSKIRVLDEQTINKIAAGEVIENPASVVKELVENALDAGATAITVEIKGGGRQLIRISDNGSGMGRDDALLCLERHATSKLKNVDEISDLNTMGFRGEAIPSIASISKFTILTCLQKEGEKNHEGTVVIVEGGKILSCGPAARSPGTTIEVKSLFFNVPVRRKFQKSPSYDAQEILKMLSLLALAHPFLKFELISDQETLLSTPLVATTQSFLEMLGKRIETIYGSAFFGALRPISFQHESCSIEGYIGLPSYTRHNRTGQTLFINRRAVSCPSISYAIKEGYGTTLPAQRYPVFVCHLQIPGDLVDVNVHPQKREVRLRQEHILKEQCIKAVQQGLQQNGFEEVIMHDPNAMFQPDRALSQTFLSSFPWEEGPAASKAPIDINEAAIPEKVSPVATISLPPKPMQTYSKDLFEPPQAQRHQSLRVLATLPGYILIDPSSGSMLQNEGISLIDQRAAYARIIYERIIKQQESQQGVQILLFPETIEFSLADALVIQEYLEEIRKLGFGIREFGKQAFVVDAIPPLVKESDLHTFLCSLLQDLRESQKSKQFHSDKEKHIATIASRHSRSKQKLSLAEAQACVDQLLSCDFPFQCPLGRPTKILMTTQDISVLFK